MSTELRLKSLDKAGLLERKGGILQKEPLTVDWLSFLMDSLTAALAQSTLGNLGPPTCHYSQISSSLPGLNCYEPMAALEVFSSLLRNLFSILLIDCLEGDIMLGLSLRGGLTFKIILKSFLFQRRTLCARGYISFFGESIVSHLFFF